MLRTLRKKSEKRAWEGLQYLYEKTGLRSHGLYAREVMGLEVGTWYAIQRDDQSLTPQVAQKIAAHHGISIICDLGAPHPELLRTVASVKNLLRRAGKE